MNTTLENLPVAIKENRMRNLAENIVKYQKFKTSAFIDKIDNAGYTKWSLTTLISAGVMYLNTGKINKNAPSSIFKYIDEFKDKSQVLLPSKKQERGIARGAALKNTAPVQKVLKQISDKAKDDSKYQLAVKVGDSIKLASNKTYADAFLDGMKFLGKTDAKLVKVRIEDID